MKKTGLSRRTFLQNGGMLSAAGALLPRLLLPSAFSNAQAVTADPKNSGMTGKVVLNYNDTHTASTVGGNAASQAVIKKMVDDGIKLLTGKSDVGEAWRSLFPATFSPTSKVAVKVNLRNTMLAPHPFVAMGIAEGLLQMSIGGTLFPGSNLYFYDGNTSSQFSSAGYISSRFPAIPSGNFSISPLSDHGDGARSAQYSDIVNSCDFLINLAALKGHDGDYSGLVTLGFKNHYGTYPPQYHDIDNTPAYLRDINCTGPVYAKTVLTVISGIHASYEGEQPGVPASSYRTYSLTRNPDSPAGSPGPNTIILSADPVAAEFQAIKIIRIQGGKTYGANEMPHYLRASAGIEGALTDKVCNIGVIDEAGMTVGEIINGQITAIGTEQPLPEGIGKESSLRVYPNPGKSAFFFELYAPDKRIGQSAALELFDISGRKVWDSRVLIAGRRTTMRWDKMPEKAPKFTPGKYFAQAILGTDILRTQLTILP